MMFKTSSFSILAAFATLFVTSCGKKDSNTSSCSEGNQVNSVCFRNLTQENINFSNGVLSGTGSVVAVEALAESSDSGRNISLTFSVQEGGSLVLRTFAKNDLTGGIDIKLSRVSSRLSLNFIKGNDVSASRELEGVDATSEIKLILDIHNDESPAHIVVWNGAGTFNKDQKLLDSEEENSIQPAGKGGDKFWGFSLNNASLSNVIVGDPKDED
jgi:hypothetical protein